MQKIIIKNIIKDQKMILIQSMLLDCRTEENKSAILHKCQLLNLYKNIVNEHICSYKQLVNEAHCLSWVVYILFSSCYVALVQTLKFKHLQSRVQYRALIMFSNSSNITVVACGADRSYSSVL